MAKLTWPEKIVNDNDLLGSGSTNASKWLSLALQSAKMCAYKWDLETNVIVRSDQSSMEPRVDPTSDSWIFQEGLKNIYPDDQEFVNRKVREAIDTYQDFNIEFRTEVEKGNIRWLQSKGHAIYGDHGRAIYVLAVTQEITQRKEDELRLQNQKRELAITREQLKLTLEVAGIIAITDRRPGVKFKSPEVCRLFGIEDEDTELDRDFLTTFIHPDDRPHIVAVFDKVISEGGPIEVEHRVQLADGRVRWVMVKGAQFFFT